jgi:gluconolactonase
MHRYWLASVLGSVWWAGVLAAPANNLTVVTTAAYPEGPVWAGDRLLFVEYAGPGITAWKDGQKSIFWNAPGCGASGLIHFGPDHWLVACYDWNAIVELDADGHVLRRIDRDSMGKPFVGPNDFTSDLNGGVYFTASGVYELAAPITGAVLHLSANGAHPVEVANTIHYSNGLTVSADGHELLVAEMLAGRILSFPIQADGSLGVRSVWARLQDWLPPPSSTDGLNGPDGIKVDAKGNYYIAENGAGRVLVVDAARKLVRIIVVPTPYVTNIGLGPAGSTTLYITGLFNATSSPYPGAVYRWAE